MKITRLHCACLLLIAAMPLTQATAATPDSQDQLSTLIAQLDNEVFDAFNRCSDPAQLQKHAGYFDANVEFYHDTGGVTWTRDDMLANTKKYVCGNFTRELVPGTLKVTPIKDFGAIAQGVHRFCQAASGKCEGLADFAIVWRNQNGKWEITRVLSYAHRASTDAQ